MKKKIGIIFYLLICSAVISAGIYAGAKNHANCRECKLSVSKHYDESNKFAGACK
jgi:hypothetical protein